MTLKAFATLIRTITIGGASSRIRLYLQLSNKPGQLSIIKRLIYNRIQKFGIHISPNAIIGENINFPHPVGIVIGSGASIGRGVTIFQNVTIGGLRIGDATANNYPTIGNGVVIFAGAVIVGKISIGDNAVIGANAVVLNGPP